MEPAAIRHKNPGAMWPGAIATKWGSTKWVYLNDGTGQGGNGKGNKIATFDNWVDGICAQLDLWRTSANYKNKKFADAIAIWSGGNDVPAYIKYVKARIPGMDENTIMNDAFWRSPNGIKFLKVQAGHEAGKPIPAPEADWVEAQRRVMGGSVPAPAAKQPVNGKTVAAGTAGATVATGGVVAAAQSGVSALHILFWIGGLSLLAAIVGLISYRIIKGTWPWISTGKASLALSPLSLQNSGPSSEQLSAAQSALQLAALQEAPLRRRSVLKKPRKRSAKLSRKTLTRRRKSSASKASAAKKSSRRRKSASKR